MLLRLKKISPYYFALLHKERVMQVIACVTLALEKFDRAEAVGAEGSLSSLRDAVAEAVEGAQLQSVVTNTPHWAELDHAIEVSEVVVTWSKDRLQAFPNALTFYGETVNSGLVKLRYTTTSRPEWEIQVDFNLTLRKQ